jgi:hypothetical protein
MTYRIESIEVTDFSLADRDALGVILLVDSGSYTSELRFGYTCLHEETGVELKGMSNEDIVFSDFIENNPDPDGYILATKNGKGEWEAVEDSLFLTEDDYLTLIDRLEILLTQHWMECEDEAQATFARLIHEVKHPEEKIDKDPWSIDHGGIIWEMESPF